MDWLWVCAAVVGLACGSKTTDDASSLSGADTEMSGSTSASASNTGPTTDPTTSGESSGGPTSCFGGMECIPAIPADWSGPVALGRGQNAPPCADAYPTEVLAANAGLQDAGTSCETCTCGDAAGLDCVPNDEVDGMPGGIAFYDDPDCNQPGTSHDLMPVDTCTPLTGPVGDFGALVAIGMSGEDPMCPASGGEETLEEITWLTSAVVCQSEALEGTCSGSDICAPLPPADFEERACIHRAGDHECPSTYPNRSTFFGGIEDTRACTECSCGPPASIFCITQAELYSDSACQTMQTIIKAGECNQMVPTGVPQSVIFKVPSMSGNCVAAGGEASGEVTASDPVTVCCL